MHKEILNQNQIALLPLISSFKRAYYLVGGTAFALGRRSKWKDYVDLYFIITRFFSIKEIAGEAEKIFTSQFSEKLFRAQLAFHKDIDYSEEVEYVIPNPPTPDEIRNGLIEKAADFF